MRPPCALRREFLSEDRLLKLEAIAAPPERPREDRHDRGVGLHLEESQRRRRRRRASEEGNEDGLAGQDVLVHEDRDGLVSRHRAQELPRRLLLRDRAVAEPPAEPAELLLVAQLGGGATEMRVAGGTLESSQGVQGR